LVPIDESVGDEDEDRGHRSLIHEEFLVAITTLSRGMIVRFQELADDNGIHPLCHM
jgi:hypothetical protein